MEEKKENIVSLLELLQSSAQAERINTVERALTGSGVGQKNFKGEWAGYKLNNSPTVKVKGRYYNVKGTGFSGLPIGREVSTRVGKNSIYAHWK